MARRCTDTDCRGCIRFSRGPTLHVNESSMKPVMASCMRTGVLRGRQVSLFLVPTQVCYAGAVHAVHNRSCEAMGEALLCAKKVRWPWGGCRTRRQLVRSRKLTAVNLITNELTTHAHMLKARASACFPEIWRADRYQVRERPSLRSRRTLTANM